MIGLIRLLSLSKSRFFKSNSPDLHNCLNTGPIFKLSAWKPDLKFFVHIQVTGFMMLNVNHPCHTSCAWVRWSRSCCPAGAWGRSGRQLIAARARNLIAGGGGIAVRNVWSIDVVYNLLDDDLTLYLIGGCLFPKVKLIQIWWKILWGCLMMPT
jgi:hypothetical protein